MRYGGVGGNSGKPRRYNDAWRNGGALKRRRGDGGGCPRHDKTAGAHAPNGTAEIHLAWGARPREKRRKNKERANEEGFKREGW